MTGLGGRPSREHLHRRLTMISEADPKTSVAEKDSLQKEIFEAHSLILSAPIAMQEYLFEEPHQFWFPWRRPELWLTFVSGLLPTLLPFLQGDEPVRNQ